MVQVNHYTSIEPDIAKASSRGQVKIVATTSSGLNLSTLMFLKVLYAMAIHTCTQYMHALEIHFKNLGRQKYCNKHPTVHNSAAHIPHHSVV